MNEETWDAIAYIRLFQNQFGICGTGQFKMLPVNARLRLYFGRSWVGLWGLSTEIGERTLMKYVIGSLIPTHPPCFLIPEMKYQENDGKGEKCEVYPVGRCLT